MSQVFSIKMPPFLYDSLEKASHRLGQSKGALVRQALEMFLSQSISHTEQIQKITQALSQKKKTRFKVNWKDIYQKTRGASDLTPEEEVRKHRLRG